MNITKLFINIIWIKINLFLLIFNIFFKINELINKYMTRRISIPFKVRKYILKKFSNKNTGGTDGISLNYILSQINSSAKLRR